MKKTFILVLSMIFCFCFVTGCAGNTTPNSTPSTSDSETSDPSAPEDVTYTYGTARLTWEQFWSNEEITYDASNAFDATNENTDTEGVTDLGGFDAVTRATSKHGVYRGSSHYSTLLHASDESGNEVSVYLEDLTDAADVADMYGAGSNFYGLANGTYCLTQPEGDATVYTVSSVEIVGYKAWPVKVPADQVEAAYETINFVEDSTVNEETSMLKTVSISNGVLDVSAANAASGAAVDYDGSIAVSYNDAYGDYVFVELSDCPEDWGMNLLGATYSYYGDVNPAENTNAAPVATYGTKYAADTWWKSNGKLLQFGINTSFRHGGAEQYGYWQITIMSAGYENKTVTVLALPAYESEVSAVLGEDKATLTITGISDEDWAKTTVSVDGSVVENVSGGVAVLSEQTIGAHTVTVNVEGYRENTLEVIVMSNLTAADITLESNVLKLNGDLENYLSNITGIAVGETTLSGRDLGHTVFNADGSVNFAAEIAGRGGSTVVFPDGSNESYVLIISAAGYPDVVLTTTVAN